MMAINVKRRGLIVFAALALVAGAVSALGPAEADAGFTGEVEGSAAGGST